MEEKQAIDEGRATSVARSAYKPEKQSKYISIRSGVSSSQGDARRVLLSLPRVKWLDRQPDYMPWPPLEEPKPKPKIVTGFRPAPYAFKPHLRNDKLSLMQQHAWELHLSGKTNVQIGVEMNKSTNAVGKLLVQARLKLGINLK